MAITQTGAIYKSLSFDNTSSRSYGVYITGEAVYNAPEREVEMISIPGRSGSFALDHGRFENIEVTYPAGIFAENEADFAQAVSDFRNFLCSKKGYCRLSDEYNPSEYRMAVYKSGLEVDPAQLRAGEFEITFDCKPQRFLTSGETKSSVANNGTVSNPTLFDASPLLECKGYGTINIGGGTITVANIPIGNILLADSKSNTLENSTTQSLVEIARTTFDGSRLNTGDSIVVDKSNVQIQVSYYDGSTITGGSVSNQSGSGASTYRIKPSVSSVMFYTDFDAKTFTKGTSGSVTHSYTLSYGHGGSTVTQSVHVKLEYDGNQTVKISGTTHANGTSEIWTTYGYIGQINANSTKTSTDTLNIDLDIGEAYHVNGTTYTSANYAVTLPAKLPKLAPGNNTITYSNTITNFKITPRWWKV